MFNVVLFHVVLHRLPQRCARARMLHLIWVGLHRVWVSTFYERERERARSRCLKCCCCPQCSFAGIMELGIDPVYPAILIVAAILSTLKNALTSPATAFAMYVHASAMLLYLKEKDVPRPHA